VSSEDYVSTPRAVYDVAAGTYVQFVGTDINSATEHPIDRSLLGAFIELIKKQAVRRVADVGCGRKGLTWLWTASPGGSRMRPCR